MLVDPPLTTASGLVPFRTVDGRETSGLLRALLLVPPADPLRSSGWTEAV